MYVGDYYRNVIGFNVGSIVVGSRLGVPGAWISVVVVLLFKLLL